MSFEKDRENFLERNRKERLEFVDFWADFVRTHPDKEWSSQQRMLIDSQVQSARSFGMTPEAYLRMKGELNKKHE